MPAEFSVVIPTHNRIEILPEVLAGLGRQEGAPPFDVLVVDDGSSDDTPRWLQAQRPPFPLRVLTRPPRGPAAARNAGVAAAEGHWVAFLGDDTVPAPGWLRAHRAAHRERGDRREQAILGYTRWHPRMRLTPFLRYINEQGLQFGYSLIRDRERVPFNFFYTSNLSLSRDLLGEEPFDEGFPYPAWEDIEASYRLDRRGMRLSYEPAAVVEHDHPTDLERFCARQERAGYSAVVFYRRHPELGSFLGLGPEGPPPLPPAGRQRRREALVRALQKLPIAFPRLWEEVLRYHYIRGLQRGWRDGAGSLEGQAKGVGP